MERKTSRSIQAEELQRDCKVLEWNRVGIGNWDCEERGSKSWKFVKFKHAYIYPCRPYYLRWSSRKLLCFPNLKTRWRVWFDSERSQQMHKCKPTTETTLEWYPTKFPSEHSSSKRGKNGWVVCPTTRTRRKFQKIHWQIKKTTNCDQRDVCSYSPSRKSGWQWCPGKGKKAQSILHGDDEGHDHSYANQKKGVYCPRVDNESGGCRVSV